MPYSTSNADSTELRCEWTNEQKTDNLDWYLGAGHHRYRTGTSYDHTLGTDAGKIFIANVGGLVCDEIARGACGSGILGKNTSFQKIFDFNKNWKYFLGKNILRCCFLFSYFSIFLNSTNSDFHLHFRALCLFG